MRQRSPPTISVPPAPWRSSRNSAFGAFVFSLTPLGFRVFPALQAKANNIAGSIMSFKGDPVSAEPLLLQALALYESLADDRGCSGVLNHLGLLHGRAGHLAAAVEYQEASIQLSLGILGAGASAPASRSIQSFSYCIQRIALVWCVTRHLLASSLYGICENTRSCRRRCPCDRNNRHGASRVTRK